MAEDTATPPARTCAACGKDISDMRKDARVCRDEKCRNMGRKLTRRWVRVEDKRCTIVEDGQRCTSEGVAKLGDDRLCIKHKTRLHRNGSPYEVKRKIRQHGEVQALLQYAAQLTDDECFLLPSPSGGRLPVSYQGQRMTACRAVYMIRTGDDPSERFVLHTCHRGEEGCIAGSHLYLGDHQQNVRDMMEAGRGSGRRFTPEQVISMRRRFAEGTATRRQFIEEHRASPSTIDRILNGTTWRELL